MCGMASFSVSPPVHSGCFEPAISNSSGTRGPSTAPLLTASRAVHGNYHFLALVAARAADCRVPESTPLAEYVDVDAIAAQHPNTCVRRALQHLAIRCARSDSRQKSPLEMQCATFFVAAYTELAGRGL